MSQLRKASDAKVEKTASMPMMASPTRLPADRGTIVKWWAEGVGEIAGVLEKAGSGDDTADRTEAGDVVVDRLESGAAAPKTPEDEILVREGTVK